VRAQQAYGNRMWFGHAAVAVRKGEMAVVVRAPVCGRLEPYLVGRCVRRHGRERLVCRLLSTGGAAAYLLDAEDATWQAALRHGLDPVGRLAVIDLERVGIMSVEIDGRRGVENDAGLRQLGRPGGQRVEHQPDLEPIAGTVLPCRKPLQLDEQQLFGQGKV